MSHSQRHDHREYSYKPQFYDPEKMERENTEKYDSEYFAKTMKRKWQEKRPSSRDQRRKSSRKTIIWASLFIIVLFYIYYKFFMH